MKNVWFSFNSAGLQDFTIYTETATKAAIVLDKVTGAGPFNLVNFHKLPNRDSYSYAEINLKFVEGQEKVGVSALDAFFGLTKDERETAERVHLK